jgi:hypothetical protein
LGFGDFFGLGAGDFFGLGVGDFFGLGVGDFFGLGVGDFFGVAAGNFFGLAIGDFFGVGVGGGVLAGDDSGGALALALCNLDFSGVRCADSRSPAVGNGITVGSSIAVGRFAGVGVGVGVGVALAAALALGVDVPTGSNKRPRLCEIVGDAVGLKVSAELTLGTGVCAVSVTTRHTNPTDNAKYFRMASARFLELLFYGVGVVAGEGVALAG